MKKRFGWGTGIVVVIIVFVLFFISFIIFSLTQELNLVTDDYYAKQVKYEQQIEKVRNSVNITDKVKVEIQNRNVIVSFPAESGVKGNTVSIYFYNIQFKDKDFSKKNTFSAISTDTIDCSALSPGRYKMHFNWTFNSKDYFVEKEIFLK